MDYQQKYLKYKAKYLALRREIEQLNQTSLTDNIMIGGGTHRENFLKKYNLKDKGYSLKELSKISKVPFSILLEVYNRGIGAYKTNRTSVRMKGSYAKNVDAPYKMKLSKVQWAFARTYSYLDHNPKHDTDLRKKIKN